MDGCKPVACSSRYLNTLEVKKTKKSSALLVFVWLGTYSPNHDFVITTEVKADRKLLIGALNGNKEEKTCLSWLTR